MIGDNAKRFRRTAKGQNEPCSVPYYHEAENGMARKPTPCRAVSWRTARRGPYKVDVEVDTGRLSTERRGQGSVKSTLPSVRPKPFLEEDNVALLFSPFASTRVPSCKLTCFGCLDYEGTNGKPRAGHKRGERPFKAVHDGDFPLLLLHFSLDFNQQYFGQVSTSKRPVSAFLIECTFLDTISPVGLALTSAPA